MACLVARYQSSPGQGLTTRNDTFSMTPSMLPPAAGATTKMSFLVTETRVSLCSMSIQTVADRFTKRMCAENLGGHTVSPSSTDLCHGPRTSPPGQPCWACAAGQHAQTPAAHQACLAGGSPGRNSSAALLREVERGGGGEKGEQMAIEGFGSAGERGVDFRILLLCIKLPANLCQKKPAPPDNARQNFEPKPCARMPRFPHQDG